MFGGAALRGGGVEVTGDVFAESIPECDVEEWNRDFVERSEELYEALMGSRWEPLDSVDAPIPSLS